MTHSLKFFLPVLSVAALMAVSCKQQQTSYVMEATVTVKPDDGVQTCYLQLDDNTALKPTNSGFQTNPYKKEVRAHCMLTDYGQLEQPSGSPYTWRSVAINAIDTILTKNPVPAGGSYGDDPVRIINSWMTSFEDGYITLLFEGFWSTRGITHTINLAQTDEPLVYELKHNSNGDNQEPLYAARNLVAFDMHDMPVPNSDEYDVTINYVSVYGKGQVIFHHNADGTYSSPEFNCSEEEIN